MNGSGKTVAKNASALLLSQVTTWVLTLILTVVLPRYLGSTAVGKLALANSIWAIGSIIVMFGMDTLLIKEIARAPGKAADLFGASVSTRILTHLLVFGAVVLYLFAFHYPADTMIVVCVIGVGSLFWELVSACAAVLQGLEHMEYMTGANILGKLVNTTVCIALLMFKQDVFAIAAVAILAGGVTFVVQLRQVARFIPLRFRLNLHEARHLLRSGLPYLMTGMFLAAYGQVDVVVISLLVNETTIGWYGAASQLFATLMFIPNVFVTAVFPVLARMYTTSPEPLPRLMRKSFDWMMLVSIPIGLGLFVVANSLVSLLFGPDFVQSGPVLSLMGIVLILTYQNMLIGQFLISTDRQNIWTVVMAVATGCTIVLDIIIVPWCERMYGNGAIGGAISFILTEVAMMILGLTRLPHGTLGWSNVWTAGRALLAGLVMVAAIWWLRDAPIYLPVLLGAAVYAGMVLLLRLIPAEDWGLFQSILQEVKARFAMRRAQPDKRSVG
jgi:O-antigen/teichoic acid export membrane protein